MKSSSCANQLIGTMIPCFKHKRATQTAVSMYTEFVAIVTCRVMYLAFRQHRFVVNLGYGFDASDENMTTTTMLITSAFIELIFEGVVDAFALDVEWRNGVNVNEFWKMWKVNAPAFWGNSVMDGIAAVHTSIW